MDYDLSPHDSQSQGRADWYRPLFFSVKTLLFALLLIVMQFLAAPFFTARASATTGTRPAMHQATFTLDNVTVHVDTPFLPGPFLTSKPGDTLQTATEKPQIPILILLVFSPLQPFHME